MPVTPRDLRTLPKVELHVHLGGTIAAGTAADLARRHGLDPHEVLVLDPDADEPSYPARFDDFDHFVEAYLATSGVVREPGDLGTVAAAFAQQRTVEHARWTEVTFTALTHVDNGLDPDAVWDHVTEGLTSTSARIGLIVDTIRNLGPEAGERTARLAERGLARGAPIVALGLTGFERSHAATEFSMLADAAGDLGIGLSVHAGETGGPERIEQALELGAQRIGHGISVLEDAELTRRLAEQGVVFEVCPSSNVTLNLVEDLDAHPLPAMLDAGLAVTVNSDDPPFFATTLTEELAHAVRLADLDRTGLADLQRTAVRGAFLDESAKARLLDELDAWERGVG